MAKIEYITAGESHGEMLVGILKNVPAGLVIDNSFVDGELKRRMSGFGRGGRMKIECDEAKFVTGVRAHTSLGSPITAIIYNRDFENWKTVMGEDATELGEKKLTAVRPGHADLSGVLKYGFDDARNVLERASARETATKVALGSVCKLYLKRLGIEIGSHTVAIGGVKANVKHLPNDINGQADKDQVRCLDGKASAAMVEEIKNAGANGDTLGGITEIVVSGVKSGVGSYVSADRKLDGLFMREIGSIQSVKAVEIGDGIESSGCCGSAVHDEIYCENGKYVRKTNRAGGVEGGMSNGETIVLRAYIKPIPTLKNGLNTVDISSGKATVAASERSDVCAVPAAGVVCEAAAAIALCTALSEMLGGDTMQEVEERYAKKVGCHE